MTVFGFTGGSHVRDEAALQKDLRALGAKTTFAAMRDLPGTISAATP